jgi:Tfp pilus assembly protein PilF
VTALLVLAAPAWAGATLRGVVVRDHEHGAPMAGVELTAPGANPFTTGNDGQFVLTFPQGHPGQDVTVRVSRAGWEVVNDVLLDRQLPEPASAHVFEVILCVSSEREQRRMEFYRLKGNQAVEQTYRAKLAELEGRHAATVQERDRLLRERDDARKQVEEWARQAAARKPDEVSSTYKEAFRSFVDGKTDAALQLLSDERLQQEVDQAQAQLHQAVAGWLLKGQILTTKFDYKGASLAYDKAVAAAPGSTEAWWAYALFHQQQNHFAKARQGYERTLTLARQASDRALAAWTLNNLGFLDFAEDRKAEARKNFEEALAILRARAVKNPDVYRPDLAKTLSNLGALNFAEDRKAEARKNFEEALAILRPLAVKDPDVYRPDLAKTLSNLGLLDRGDNRTADARKNFEEALAILRPLAVRSPNVYRSDLAKTLNNLGLLSTDEHRKVEARKNYEEALTLYRALAVQNPDGYRPDLAKALNNLGLLSAWESRNAEARKNFEEALTLYRALAIQDPDGYRPDLATTLNNLGLLSTWENRNAEARKNFEEALALYRELAARAPATYQPHVEDVEQNLRLLSP